MGKLHQIEAYEVMLELFGYVVDNFTQATFTRTVHNVMLRRDYGQAQYSELDGQDTCANGVSAFDCFLNARERQDSTETLL